MPVEPMPTSFWAWSLAAQGNSEEAISQYQAALKNDPNNSGIYDKLGLVLDRAGKFDGAIVYFQKAVQLAPTDTDARFNLGVALLQRGNDAQGLRELAEVLRLKPTTPPRIFAWDSRSCTRRGSNRRFRISARACATSRMTPRRTLALDPH